MPKKDGIGSSLRIIPYGKADAVKRKDPATGEIEKICECQYNVEFAETGCIFQVHLGQLEEVIRNLGSYNPEHTREYRESGKWPNFRCKYCYAYRNIGNVFPKQVDDKTRADFQEFRPGFVRLGKLTECGHPYYYKTFMDFLKLAHEFNTGLIFTTKAFSFGIKGAEETRHYAEGGSSLVFDIAKEFGMAEGEKIAGELRKTNSSLLYSLGWDLAEEGACSQGFTNAWRISQAEKYYKEGVNTSLTVVCDVTSSILDNIERGSAISQAIKSNARIGINFRILPLRPRKEVFIDLVGKEWGDSVRPRRGVGYLDFCDMIYSKRKNHEAVSDFLHEDFEKFREQGIGFCGQVGDYEHCDKCFLPGMESQRIRFLAKELVHVKYDKKEKPRSRKRKNKNKDDKKSRKNKPHKNQKGLF